MIENIAIAFVGAVIALLLREGREWCANKGRTRRVAQLCAEHPEVIKKNLEEHVSIQDRSAYYSETEFAEVAVGDFLYDRLLDELSAIGEVVRIEKTIRFFHHYKVDMATLASRLPKPGEFGKASLTQDTHEALIGYLNDSILELQALSGTQKAA